MNIPDNTAGERTQLDAEFRANLLEFGMGDLKYMFKLSRTKPVIHYYGANLAKLYRQAIYDRMVSYKVRGIDCEVWQ